MNIRLMGPDDLVRAWAARLGEALGVEPQFYACRRGDGTRAYLNVDDRQAEEVALPAKPRARRKLPPRVEGPSQ